MPSKVLAVAAIIVRDGRILLIQRGNPPQQGRWTLPGGKVEAGESLQQAVRREVAEETGYLIEVGAELLKLSVPTGDGRTFQIHDFAATIVGGELVVGDDAADARWVRLADLDMYPLTDNLRHYLRQAGLKL